MRNYWLRIAAGALGIFAVGMVIITGARSIKSKVTSTLESSEPISIPLVGLIPFRLDEARLGSLDRVELLRSDPEHVSGVRVLIKLSDSVSLDRLRSCQLAVENVDQPGQKTSFRCLQQGDDLAGLEQFGTVVVKRTGEEFPLLLPGKAVADLKGTTFRFDHKGLHVEGPRDLVAEAMTARTDSLRDALDEQVSARSDSADVLRGRAEALEDSSNTLPARDRRQVQRSADSVRAAMRAMVDRLKADEARSEALNALAGLSATEIDSLAQLGKGADSIQVLVARELRQALVEVRKAQPTTEVRVEAPKPR